jgi:hypothetical protein
VTRKVVGVFVRFQRQASQVNGFGK